MYKRVNWVLGILISAIVVFLIMKQVDSNAAVALLGALIGGGISSATSFLLANRSYKQQMSMVALEKRLAVHQEAYAIWRRISFNVFQEDKINGLIIDAQEWWANNCLYLDAESRDAFYSCLLYANNHRNLSQKPLTTENEKELLKSWAIINKPGKTLVEGVALPNLGELETGLTKEENQRFMAGK